MPDVTIEGTITGLVWTGGAAPTLIIEAAGPFITAEGVPMNNGNSPFRAEYATSVDGSGYVVLPDVELPSTEDSSDPTAVYRAYFRKSHVYDAASKTSFATFDLPRGFRVPASPTTTTWEEIDENMASGGLSGSGDRTINGSLTVTQDLDVGGDTHLEGGLQVDGFITSNDTLQINDDVNVSGNVTATAFVGNGAGLTGIGAGTGGVINTGSTTIGADSDANGVGKISLQTRGIERASIESDGTLMGFTSARKVYASLRGAALNSNLTSGGGTDDTAAIQALLDLASGGTPVHIVIDGVARVGALNVYSNTTIECPAGCGFYLKNGANRALLRNANPTIGAISDHDITLIGGTYNGNSVNQTGIGLFDTQEVDGTLIGLIQMFGVRRLKIRGVRAFHSKTIACHISNAVDVHVDDLYVDNNVVGQYQQGGLQFDGPCSHFTVSNLRGTTQDDLFAFNTDDNLWVNESFIGLGPYITGGDITDFTVNGIVGENAFSGVRFFNATHRIDRGRISNITGTFSQVIFNNDPLTIGPGNVGTLVVDGINASVTAEYSPGYNGGLLNIFARAEHLVFRDINLRNTLDTRTFVKVNAGATIGRLEIDGLCITDTSALAAGCIPIEIKGKVKRLSGRNWKWDRDSLLAQATDFLKLTAATGLIEELDLDGVRVNKCTHLINQNAGALLAIQMRGIRQIEGGGGLTFRNVAGITSEFLLSNWHGDNCAPYAVAVLGDVKRRRGDAFPADTTVPTYTSGAANGGSPVVSITFSEAINARDYATGVVIKKNTVTQTISSAKRREGRANIVDFVLSANISGGDAVTWEYAAASGSYADWSNNLLANVSAQTVTVSGAGQVFDIFTAANGTALSGRTPSPVTNSAHTWSVLRGASAQQTIQGNRAQLDGLLAAQALIVDAGAANISLRVVARALPPYNDNTSNGFGIPFRASDANNYWLFWVSPNTTTLFKVVAGVTTQMSTQAIPHIEDRPYELVMVLNGSAITCVVDAGETVFATDAFNSTVQNIGIQALGCLVWFDDFYISAP